MKQKQRLERVDDRNQTSLPTPETLYEELPTSWSGSEFSQTDNQHQETQSLFDISTAEAQQQQYPMFSDDCDIHIQPPTPPLSTPQPQCTHATNSGTMPGLFHTINTGSQQQPVHNCYDNFVHTAPHQFFPPTSDECDMALQQSTSPFQTAQPHYAQASISGINSCQFHAGGQQHTTHNSCNGHAPKALQQQFVPLDHDLQHFTHQLSASRTPCVCTPGSNPTSYHSQVQPASQHQRIHSFYNRSPLPASSRIGSSEDCSRALYDHSEQSCGAPAVNFSSPFNTPQHVSHPYIALPSSTKRRCCCHHSHVYTPAVGHMPMNGFDMHALYPFQGSAQGHTNAEFL
ncbi:uncharacterized protein K452DRAFT_150653 [Aplosporella prunicola CBS 121167]|uniref:Uncharacterized protein n=1 Tax=Aplosporella prunicola CBS 121167 TaxID=1176127 RepID=A0A6A6BIW1_9PEZI|nr:uncharacterized protein K452DRAFT_150653 [Aplosporella prunicola CBS 121167]KAF2143956.1 hypothetical protein K452DRAFT_150653 [Aplosporella prunicola CBS 121167]